MSTPRPLLLRVLRPFVEAIRKAAEPIPDSDLDNEQPRSVHVTLGDCRRLDALFVFIETDIPQPSYPKEPRT